MPVEDDDVGWVRLRQVDMNASFLLETIEHPAVSRHTNADSDVKMAETALHFATFHGSRREWATFEWRLRAEDGPKFSIYKELT